MKILNNDTKTKYASVGTVATMIISIVMLSSFSNAFAGGGYVYPPYSNGEGFPVTDGGCTQGIEWCDMWNLSAGKMYLFDDPAAGQGISSYIYWNDNPYTGNSPTAYFTSSYNVYWGSTWDSIGTIDEVNYPFTGKALTGVQIYYCNDTSTTCTSNLWDYVMFEGTEWDGPQNVDLTNQNVGTWITQNANHLYTSNPYGYAEGDSESCGGTCYGSGETDFGNANNLSNSNWMLFHNIYANWI
ncbi:MAG: hypothetical protein KGI02_08720 [Thaumarchaeota archaeon]|nr:hypothetical protein [Nitrososphaerota archaeon]